MTYEEALEQGYIDKYSFLKCPYCGSTLVGFNRDKPVYSEDVCGCFMPCEGTIECHNCKKELGYYAYGISEIYYLEDENL